MISNTILIVDDEIGIRELLSEILREEGYQVTAVENAEQARKSRKQTRPDLILLDIWMPDTDGITLLKEWVSNGSLTMPVIIMSGHGSIETAIEATRIGAFDYLEKPIPLQKLLSTVKRSLQRGQIESAPIPSLADLGNGPLIINLRKQLEQIAHLKTPLLLMGEQGTGVELCAHFLRRPNAPWIETDTLISFTDSPFNLLEQAKDGLLFLKEIGGFDKQEQKNLLLLISNLEKYNVRLVCATSVSLVELVEQGSYDLKLYQILNGLCIQIPPLKEHREDIPDLVNQILTRYIESNEISLRQFSTAALNFLRNHNWSGNLTQLTSTIHSLALTSASEEISIDEVKRILSPVTPLQNISGISFDAPLREARDLFEKIYFERLINYENGSMSRVAERSGLERTHLYRKLKLLGIKLRNH